MNEAQLRTVVEEVVKALAAKGLLKSTGECQCENGPKPLKGEVKTTIGAAGKDDDEHVDDHLIKSAGADRVSVCNPTKKGNNTARYVDHTMLKPNATQDEIAKLCEEARSFCFASVCVNPSYVALSA